MKKFIYAAMFFIATFTVFESQAQINVNKVPLSEITATYIEIEEYSRLFSDKVFISLDYGQKIPIYTEAFIKDDDNKNLEFNSLVDAANKFRSYGYELFLIYTKTGKDSDSKKVYVLKKRT